MAGVRPMNNDEVGLFCPVRELVDPQLSKAREMAGNYLVRLVEAGETLTERPLVVELEDGTTSVQYFTLITNTFEN